MWLDPSSRGRKFPICSQYLLGWDKREILVWHYRMNHCIFYSLLRLSERLIIPRDFSKVRKLPPYFFCLFGKSHNSPWITKGKHSGGCIRNPSETITRAFNLPYDLCPTKDLPPIYWGTNLWKILGSHFFWTTTLTTDMLRSNRKKGRGRMDTYIETSSITFRWNWRNFSKGFMRDLLK